MKQRSLYIAIALIFIISLVASIAILMVESQTADPITGLPVELKGKVTYTENGFSTHGAISADQWKMIQQFMRPGSFNPYQHWGVNRTDSHATMSYVFYDASLKGVGAPWIAAPDKAGWGPIFSRLFAPIINEFKSMLRDAMGFFTTSASAACPTNSTCFWGSNSGGNWSSSVWAASCVSTGALAQPTAGAAVVFCATEPSAAATVTCDTTTNCLGASLTVNNTNLTIEIGTATTPAVQLTIGTSAAGTTNGCTTTTATICVVAGKINTATACNACTLTTSSTAVDAIRVDGANASMDFLTKFTTTGGKITVTGAGGGMNVGNAASFVRWGPSTAHKFLGAWSNVSTSASWGVGTGTVTFAKVAASTVTFTPGCASGCPAGEFFNMTFDQTSATAVIYALATRTLKWDGTLTVQDSTAGGTMTLDASAASTGLTGGTTGSLTIGTRGVVIINTIPSSMLNMTMNGGTSGTFTPTTATVTVNGNWDSSGAGSVFNKNTSTVVMAGTSKTINFLSGQNFNNLTINGTISTTGTNIDATSTMLSGTLTGTGTFTVTGNWDSSTGYTFTKSTSTIVMSGASKTVKEAAASANGFNNLTISGTVTISVNPLDVTGTLATSGSGVLTTGGINITGAGSLSTAGTGGLTATTSVTTFLNVTVGSGTTFSYTSGSCTCSGNWDSSAGTFTKGTSTVTMSGSSKTVKENGTAGFNNLSITGTITASNAINVAATFTLTAPGTYTTTSADLNIGATTGTATNGDVLVSSGGTFTMSGAVAFTAPSNWDSSGGTFTKSTSTVTMSGTTKTVKQQSASANGFYNLTVSGTVTISVNPLDVSNTLATSGSGTLTTGGINITGGSSLSLVGTGGLTASTSTTTFLDVTVGTGTTFSYTSGACTCSGNWDSSAGTFTKGTSTVTMTGASKTIKENGTAGFNNLTIDTGASITANSAINVGATFQMNTTGTYTTTGQDLFIGATTSTGTAGDVTVSSGGTFTMNGSVAFTAPSNWDSSGGTFTKSTSTVTMSGTTKTVKQQSASTNGFYNLTVSGTVTISVNPLDVSNTLATSGSGVLTTGGINITGGSSLSTAGTGGLTATTSTVTFLNVTVGTGTTFSFTSGACTCSGNWDSSAGTFTKGTSTVTLTGSGKTVKENGTAGFNNLTIETGASITASNAINVAATFRMNTTATYTTTSADLNIGATTGTATNGDVLVSSGGTFLMSGSVAFTAPSNWDSSGGTFTKSTSTVTMSGTTKTVKQQSASANGFNNLTVSGTVTISVNPLDVTGTLATSGSGTLTTGGINITGGAAVSLVGTGGITGTTSTITVGTVTVGNGTTFSMTTGTVNSTDVTMTGGVSGVISFSGSGAWNASGNWDTSGAGSTFTKSTSVVTLSGTTKTVKILNSSNNFYSLTISGTISTVSGNSVSNTAAGTLSITGTYTLVSTHTTNGSVVSGGGNLTVNTAGTFDATSTTSITLGDVTMTSATSGTITLSGSPAVSIGGNWNTSGTGTTFTKATSTVTMTGASKTVAIRNATNDFYNLTIAGSVTMNSAISVDNAATVNGSQSLTLNANNLTVGASGLSGVLTVTGNLVGAATATGWTVTLGASDTFTVSAVTTWTANSDFKWTDSATGSNSFTIAINVTVGNGTHYDVRKDGADFTNGTTAASKITFTMLPSDPVIEVTLNTASTCSGGTCYWISATGNFDQGTHWATSSGGAACQCTPGSSDNVVFDASSGTGTATQNIAAFTTVDVTATSGSMTIALSSNGWTASGNWDTSGGSIVLTKGTSTITLSGTTKTVKILNSSNGFYNLTISGTITISTNALDVSQTLATSGSGTLTTGGLNITGGAAVSLVGTGGITGTTSTITVGAVTVGNGTTFSMTTGTVNSTDVTMTGGASGVISFSGAGAWNASGNWDTSGVGSTFTKSTSTVALSGTTKTVKTLNSTNGFYNLTTSGTITMSNATDISNTLSVSGTLATADKTITGGSNLSVPNGGTLTANASTATFTNVTMTGGTSGTITLTSGSWTVHGNWDTSGAGSTFTQGTSTVTMDGASKTLKMLAATAFATLVIAGTISLLSDEKAKTLTINNTKTLTMSGFSIFFNHLDNNNGGTISSTANATNFDVTNSDSSAYTKISIFSIWNLVGGEQKWTHTSDTPTSTMTFTISGLGTFTSFNVTKDGGAFTSGAVVAGVVTFTMLGSDPVIDVTESAGCTPNCYWVGGGGNWSDGTHWASVSGGAGQGSAPNATTPVFFDANSGVGTVTVDVNATMASFDSTASTIGTIAIGTKDFTTNGGAVTHVAGTITISTGTVESGAVTLSATITATGAAAFTVTTVTINAGGVFTVNAASVASTSVTMTSASSGTITMTSGSWTASGNWDTSGTGTTFTKGTSTVTLSGTTKTVKTRNSTNGFYNLTITGTITQSSAIDVSHTLSIAAGTLTTSGNAVSGDFDLTVTTAGSFVASTSVVSVNTVTMTDGTASTISMTSGVFFVDSNWDTSGNLSTFTKGTGTVSLGSGGSSTVKIRNSSNGFYDLTIAAGSTVTQSSAIDVSDALLISGGGGTLVTSGNNISGGASLTVSGTLTGTTAVITVGNVTVTGTLTMTSGSITASGNWDSSTGTFTKGTSTVTLTGSSKTISINGTAGFASLIINGGASYTMSTALDVSTSLTVGNGTTDGSLTTASLALSGGGSLTMAIGTLTANASTVTVGAVQATGGTNVITLTSGSWTVSGNWDTSGGASTFTKGTSTITMTGASKTLAIRDSSNGFYNLTITGTITQASAIDVSNAISITGTLTTSGFNITGGANLTVSGGGTLTGTTASITVGDVTMIGASANTISLTSGSMSVAGNWDTSGASSTFTKGTSTVTMSGATKTVKTLNSSNGFYSLTISGTVTMASAIDVSNLTTISGTLATADFALSGGGSLTISTGGTFTANASTVTVLNVTMVSAVSGTITITTGQWTVSGNWDTSGTGTMFSSGTDTVTMTGSGKTVALRNSSNGFDQFVVSGSVTQNTTLWTRTLTVTGTLTKIGFSIVFFSLTATTGSIVDTAAVATNFTVTNSDGAARTTISVLTIWSANSEFKWTHTSSIGTTTITFTIGGNTSGNVFTVTKDGAAFMNDVVNGSGQVIFTMLGSDPVMDVKIISTGAGNRYLVQNDLFCVLNGDKWSDVFCWSATSGGSGGAGVPTSATDTFMDANSGATSFPLDMNGMVNTLDTSAFPGTFAIGSFNFTSTGAVLAAGGTITISTGTFTATTLTLADGTTIFTVSGAATFVLTSLTVTGNATFNANAGTVSVGNVTMNDGAASSIVVTTGAWDVSGNWDTSSASFTKGTSTITLSGATKTVQTRNASNGFYNLTVSGTITQASAIDVSNTLLISGTLTTAGNNITGGANLSVSNAGTLVGSTAAMTFMNVSVTGGINGSITMTSGSMTVLGNWDTSGTGSVFTKGTSTVTMSGSSKTVKILDVSNGFYNFTISGTVSQLSAIDVSNTLATSGSGTLTTSGFNVTGGAAVSLVGTGGITATTSSLTVGAITVGSGTTLSITTGTITAFGAASVTGTLTDVAGNSGIIDLASNSLTVNNGGAFNGNQATITTGNVTMTGGVNGAITLTSAAWTVHGNWDTSGAGSTFTQGTSTITMDGAAKTLKMLATNLFATLVIAGTVSLLSDGRAKTMTVNIGKTFTMTGFSIVFNHLSDNNGGSVVDGGVTTTGLDVTNSESTALTTISVFTVWTTNTQYKWTHTSSSPTTTITFTIGGNTVGSAFRVLKDGTGFTTGTVNGSGQVVFTMLGSDPVVQVDLLGAETGNRYLVLGDAGCVSSAIGTNGFCWAFVSGGSGGAGVPNAGKNVFMNANSGAVTGTLDASMNITTGTYSSAGFTGTFAISTFTFQNTGTFTHSGGTITVSTGTINVGATTITATMTATGAATLTFVSLTVGTAGVLNANAATVSVGDVTMTGGVSGMITLTTGQWTVTGNWNTSGAGSTFTAGTSTVTMSGASKTVALLNSSNGFDTLVVSGTVTANTSVWTRILTVSGTLTKTGQSIVFKTLTVTSGSVVDGAVTVTGFQVGNSEAGARTTISAFTLWIVGTEYKWNHTSSSPTTTITFTIGGNTTGQDWLAKKNAVFFSNGIVDGSGNIVFTMLGSDPAMDITTGVLPRYLVLNDGACVPTAIATTAGCWSLTSGGAGGSTVPDSMRGAYEDANSGAGTGTFDASMSVNFWNMTAFTGTIDTAGFNLTIGNALTVQGALMSGSSAVIVGGGVTILTTSSYITNGVDGIWTVSGGNWSNASTSPSWSFFSILRFSGAGAQSVGGSGSKNVFHSVVVSGGDKTFTQNFTTSGFTASGNVNVFVTASTVTWTIRAASVIRGVVGTLTIRSTVDGTHWIMIALDVPLGVKAFGVNVKDSDASGGSTIDATDCSNFDAGGNLNWLFGSGCAGGGGGGGGGGGPAELTLSIIQTGDFTFEFTVTGNRGPLTYISWNFGDGVVVNNGPTTISHAYRQSGAFTVTVAATMAATQYSARATVYTGAPLAFGYLLAIMVSVTILAVLLLRKNEKLRSRVAILALGLLALQISAYFNFQETALYMSIVTLGFAAMALVLAVLPRAPTRPRGLWIIIGVLALLLWIYLALPLPSL